MSIVIDIQNACDFNLPFSLDEITSFAKAPFEHFNETGELTLRISSTQEIHELNHSYRNQDKPTNVLAFPSSLPDNIDLDIKFWGDIIICPEVIFKEAESYQKPLRAHWSHIIIHGVLHLMGYDHIEDKDADVMHAEEVSILKRFNITNPYTDKDMTT